MSSNDLPSKFGGSSSSGSGPLAVNQLLPLQRLHQREYEARVQREQQIEMIEADEAFARRLQEVRA